MCASGPAEREGTTESGYLIVGWWRSVATPKDSILLLDCFVPRNDRHISSLSSWVIATRSLLWYESSIQKTEKMQANYLSVGVIVSRATADIEFFGDPSMSLSE